ncbi:hypothetical protein D3C72_2130640 [compost metagenome]
MQRIGIAHRARHIVAAVHDDAGDVGQLIRIAQQLPVFQPAAVREVMILQPRKGQREMAVGVLGAVVGIGQQRDRLPFPHAPRARRFYLLVLVVAGQQLAVGGHHVAALGLGHRRLEALPFLGEHL